MYSADVTGVKPQPRKEIKFVGASSEATRSKESEVPAQRDWGAIYARAVGLEDKTETIFTADSSADQELANSTSHQDMQLADDDMFAVGPLGPPPAAVNRKNKGLKIMESWGYDVDERMGLGIRGEGIRESIQVQERKMRAGLGRKDSLKLELKEDHKAKAVKKTKGQKCAAREAARDEEREKHDRLYKELFG